MAGVVAGRQRRRRRRRRAGQQRPFGEHRQEAARCSRSRPARPARRRPARRAGRRRRRSGPERPRRRGRRRPGAPSTPPAALMSSTASCRPRSCPIASSLSSPTPGPMNPNVSSGSPVTARRRSVAGPASVLRRRGARLGRSSARSARSTDESSSSSSEHAASSDCDGDGRGHASCSVLGHRSASLLALGRIASVRPANVAGTSLRRGLYAAAVVSPAERRLVHRSGDHVARARQRADRPGRRQGAHRSGADAARRPPAAPPPRRRRGARRART